MGGIACQVTDLHVVRQCIRIHVNYWLPRPRVLELRRPRPTPGRPSDQRSPLACLSCPQCRPYWLGTQQQQSRQLVGYDNGKMHSLEFVKGEGMARPSKANGAMRPSGACKHQVCNAPPLMPTHARCNTSTVPTDLPRAEGISKMRCKYCYILVQARAKSRHPAFNGASRCEPVCLLITSTARQKSTRAARADQRIPQAPVDPCKERRSQECSCHQRTAPQTATTILHGSLQLHSPHNLGGHYPHPS